MLYRGCLRCANNKTLLQGSHVENDRLHNYVGQPRTLRRKTSRPIHSACRATSRIACFTFFGLLFPPETGIRNVFFNKAPRPPPRRIFHQGAYMRRGFFSFFDWLLLHTRLSLGRAPSPSTGRPKRLCLLVRSSFSRPENGKWRNLRYVRPHRGSPHTSFQFTGSG